MGGPSGLPGGPRLGIPRSTLGAPAVAVGMGCSMKATWRQLLEPSAPVLSKDMPSRSNSSVLGSRFHSLQAPSHALQPMHTLVSVKNPLRGGGSLYPASTAGSMGPKRLFLLTIGVSLLGPRRGTVPGENRVAARAVRSGPLAVFGYVCQEFWPSRPAPGPHVARADLRFLDVDVDVERDAEEVIRGIAHDQAVGAPVVGQPHLVDGAPRDPQRAHAIGDDDAGLDGGARGDDVGPTDVFQAAFLGQLRRHLLEHLGLQLGEVGERAAHRAGGVMLRQPARGEDDRVGILLLLRRAGVDGVGPIAVLHAGGVGLLAVQRVDRKSTR